MRGFLPIALVAFLLQLSMPARSDEIDSLKAALSAARTDTLRYDLCLKIGKAYRDSSYTKTLEYYQKSLDAVEKTRYKELVGDSYQNIGNIYMLLGEFDLAIENLNNALSIFESIDDLKNVAGVLNDIGLVYKNRSKYDVAAERFMRALKIYEQLHDVEGISIASNSIGQVMFYKGDYKGAIEFFKKYFDVNTVLHKPYAVAGAANNIASAYLELTDYSKAIDYFFISLRIYDSLGVSIGKAVIQDNLGSLFFDIAQYEDALKYHKAALQIFEEIENPTRIIPTKINIAKIYIQQNKVGAAIAELKEALSVAEPLGNVEQARDAYELLADAYGQTDDYKKAFECLKMYHVINDSIVNVEILQNIEQIRAEYESEKRSTEFQNTQRQIARQKWFLISMGVALILVFFIALFVMKKLQHQKKKILSLTLFRSECAHEIPLMVDTSVEHLMAVNGSIFHSMWNVEPNNNDFPKNHIGCVCNGAGVSLVYIVEQKREGAFPEFISVAIHNYMQKNKSRIIFNNLKENIINYIENSRCMEGIKVSDFDLFPVLIKDGKLFNMAGSHLLMYSEHRLVCPANCTWVEPKTGDIVYLTTSQDFGREGFLRLFNTIVQYGFERQREIAMNTLGTIDMDKESLIYAFQI